MSFLDTVERAKTFLERNGRVSLSALKLEFGLDDTRLECLIDELVDVQQVAAREGKVLSWVGPASPPEAEPAAAAAIPERASDAERRQLTVMFCDLVASTALSEQLDPEELREIILAYQGLAAESVQRVDGTVAQYLGDGILVYFGTPQPHEDDARRAVHASIDILARLTDLNDRLQRDHGVRLSVRIGIHTGLVVLGEIGASDRREMGAIGETPNVASRLSDLAAPNTIMVSAATLRLLGDAFASEALGPVALKGLSQPLSVYEIVARAAAGSGAPRTELTPLVGRAAEMASLRGHWERARQGLGHTVLVSGEPGIGKSRLVRALCEEIVANPTCALEAHCSPIHQDSAFFAAIDLLEAALARLPDDDPLERLTTLLGHHDIEKPEDAALLASLLSLPLGGRYPLPALSAESQKQRTLDALRNLILSMARTTPLVLVFEDLHWVDPSTLELVTLLVDQAPTVPLLLLLLFRPEFEPPWIDPRHVSRLAIGRLERPEVVELANSLAGGRTLAAEVSDQLVEKSDGVPLFAEELSRMMLESSLLREQGERLEFADSSASLSIPSTLRDLLEARLNRAAPARHVLQLAATVGRSCTYELLGAVADVNEAALRSALVQLVEAGLLQRYGSPPHATFVFKHALIHDEAYESVLLSTRRVHHLRIARTLEERFPRIAENQPELLAHHFSRASHRREATVYRTKAAERAIARSANREALAQASAGLDQVSAVPEGAERDQLELALQFAMGVASMAVNGQAHPRTQAVYARARELCRRLGDTAQGVAAVWALWAFHMARANLSVARELAEQILAIGQREADPDLQLVGHFAGCETFFYLGELTPARHHAERSLSLYDPARSEVHVSRYGHDPGVFSMTHLALLLWMLGYPDQAAGRARDAIDLARKQSHAFSLTFALDYGALLYLLRGETSLAKRASEEAVLLAAEHSVNQWLALGQLLRGRLRAQRGDAQQATSDMRRAIGAWKASGFQIGWPCLLGLLADALIFAGEPREALAVLDAALAGAETEGGGYYIAELHRQKGAILHNAGALRHTEAEACLRQALEIARSQQAKSFELRSAAALARLWQSQGKRDEARELLQPVYDWFTEGFDTRDLKDAKALLEELA